MHFVRSAALAALALAALAACQVDQSTGLDPSLGKNDATKALGDTVKVTFTVTTTAHTFNIGDHKIVFGNKLASICDLKSSYGPYEWDKPCTPAKSSVTITAKSWTNSRGQPMIDFQPRMRFVPTSDPTKGVVLHMKDKAAAADLVNKIIRFCVDPKSPSNCVNEERTDPSVKTFIDTNGFLVRRIKHFSGYNVAAREDTELWY